MTLKLNRHLMLGPNATNEEAELIVDMLKQLGHDVELTTEDGILERLRAVEEFEQAEEELIRDWGAIVGTFLDKARDEL